MLSAQILRICARTFGFVLVATAALYGFRAQLLAPLLTQWTEGVLANSLGAEQVKLGKLRGDWWRELRFYGLQWKSQHGQLRQLRDGRLHLRLRLSELLFGNLSGIARVAVQAKRIEIDPLATSASSLDSERESGPDLELSPSDLVPQGLSAEFQDFVLSTEGRSRAGRLQVEMPPRQAAAVRKLSLLGLGIKCQVRPDDLLRGSCDLQVEQAADWLALFGMKAPVSGGRLTAKLRYRAGEKPKLSGVITLKDGQALKRSFQAAQARFSLEDQILTLEDLRLRGPGAALNSRHFAVPLHDFDVKALSEKGLGKFQLEISDLEPWREYLPNEITALLPMTGRLLATSQNGRLRIKKQQLHGKGFALTIRDAELDLVRILSGEQPKPSCESIELELQDFDGFTEQMPKELASLLPVSGKIHGRLKGSWLEIEQGSIHGRGSQLAVDAGRFPIFGEETLTKRKGFVHARVQLHPDLNLVIPPLGSIRSEAEFKLEASGSLEQPTLRMRAKLASLQAPGQQISGVTLDAHFTRAATGEEQFGLDLGGSVQDIGWQSFGLDAPDLRSPLRFSLRGTGTRQPQQDPSFDVELNLLDCCFADLPALKLQARGALDAERKLQLEQVEISGAQDRTGRAFSLQSRGQIQVAANPSFDLSLGSNGLPLAILGKSLDTRLGTRLGTRGLRGKLRFDTQLSGTLQRPIIELQAQLQAEGLFGEKDEHWPLPGHVQPPSGPFQLTLAMRSDEERIQVSSFRLRSHDSKLLDMSGQGGLPMRLSGAGLQHAPEANQPFTLSASSRPQLVGDLGAQLAALGSNQPEGLGLRAECDKKRILISVQGKNPVLGQLEAKIEWGAGLGQLIWDRHALGNKPLRAQLDLAGLDLSRLPKQALGTNSIAGSVTAKGSLDGTLLAPEPRLELHLSNGVVKASGSPRIEALGAKLYADRQGLRIKDLRGRIGAAPFELSGKVAKSGQNLWLNWERAALDLRLQGQQLLLARQDGVKVRGDLDIHLHGDFSHPLLEGQIRLQDSKYVKQISLLPDFRSSGGGRSDPAIVPFSLPGPLGERLSLDLRIDTVEALRIRTGVLSTDLNASLRLRGQAKRPFLVGSLTASKGRLALPGVSMRLQSAYINFPESRPYLAELQLHASGRRLGYRIDLSVSGDSEDPQIVFRSVPSLPPESVLVLATTGQLPAALERDSQKSLMAAGSFLANALFQKLFGSDSTEAGESWVERFTISAGEEVSNNGVESIRIEYDIDGFWFVRAERDVYEEYNADIGIRIRLD
ncbi:MAG: hypothetical protein CSA62_13005 [Planctomycetota bacterium]|nr:MAG: hypothetical protein CSA62_13005 [Planctomycetota bacterium]